MSITSGHSTTTSTWHDLNHILVVQPYTSTADLLVIVHRIKGMQESFYTTPQQHSRVLQLKWTRAVDNHVRHDTTSEDDDDSLQGPIPPSTIHDCNFLINPLAQCVLPQFVSCLLAFRSNCQTYLYNSCTLHISRGKRNSRGNKKRKEIEQRPDKVIVSKVQCPHTLCSIYE